MSDGKFKDYHSITIHGWMSNKLGLSGNKLIIYAAVFQYSSLGTSELADCYSELAHLCNISSPSVKSILEEMVQDRLIYKSEVFYKNVNHTSYKVNLKKVYAIFNKMANNNVDTK